MSFCGIDLHSDRFTVARLVLKDEGFQETLGTFNFEEESWKKFKDSLSPKDYVLIENSTNAFWFHDQVAPGVKACYVYDTNDIRVNGNKTDKIDAKKLVRKLAYYMAMGQKKEDLPVVYVPDPEIRELRGLFTTYRLYNKMKVQVKNRVHSILKANGICIDRGKIDRKAFKAQIEEFKVDEVWKLQMRSAYRELQSLAQEQEGIKRLIYSRGYARFKREVELLLGIRGFSPLTAIALMSDVVDVKRFRNARNFCSYLRATPRIRSSNQVTYVGHTNRQSRPLTCTLLTQSILQLARAGDHMAQFYQRVRVGKSAGKSRVALIRKVLVSAYHMLRKDEPYWWVEEKLYSKKLQSFQRELAELAA